MSKDIDIKSDGQPYTYSDTTTVLTDNGNRWVPEDETQLEEIVITQNGHYTPSLYAFSKVTVNVDTSPTLIEKTITTNGTYEAADDNADGSSKVTVSVDGTAVPTSISIDSSGMPKFYEGMIIDYSGLIVLAMYEDGSNVDITSECEITPAAGTYYTGQEEFTIMWQQGGM